MIVQKQDTQDEEQIKQEVSGNYSVMTEKGKNSILL